MAKGRKFLYNLAGIFINRPTGSDNRSVFNARPQPHAPILPTGLRNLDKALEIGGLPYGRLTELIHRAGKGESGGSTCLAARIAANAQRRQQTVSIIDLGHNFDPWRAQQCGLVAPHLLLNRPANLYEALSLLEEAAQSGGLVIAALGLTPYLLRHTPAELRHTLLNRLRHISRSAAGALLVLTTIRENNPFSPTAYPRGFLLAELADVRLWMQNESWTYRAGVATAYKASLTVIKNRLAPAGKGTDVRIKLNAPLKA